MTTNPPQRRGKISPPSATTTRHTLARLCSPVADTGRRQGLTGLCVSRSLEQRLAGVLYASNAVGRRLDDMQQVIGEGPGVSALAQRSPVLVPDLGDDASSARWAMFRREADLLGVASLFCFPVQLGAVDLGLMTVHGVRPLRLDADALGSYVGLSDALALAFIARDGAGGVDGADGADGADGVDMVNGIDGIDGVDGFDARDGMAGEAAADLLDSGSLVTHQAVGMVSVQLECSLEEALVALRSRAYAEGRSVGEMAREVVARRSRLGPERPAETGSDGAGEIGRPFFGNEDGTTASTGDKDG